MSHPSPISRSPSQAGVPLACGYPSSSWPAAPGSGGGWVLLAGCSAGHYPSPAPIRSKQCLHSNPSVDAWLRRSLPCPRVFVLSDLFHLQGPGRAPFPGAWPPRSARDGQAPGDASALSCVRQRVGIRVGVRSERSKSCRGVWDGKTCCGGGAHVLGAALQPRSAQVSRWAPAGAPGPSRPEVRGGRASRAPPPTGRPFSTNQALFPPSANAAPGRPPSEVLRAGSRNDSEGDPSHTARAFLGSTSAMARAQSMIRSRRISDIY